MSTCTLRDECSSSCGAESDESADEDEICFPSYPLYKGIYALEQIDQGVQWATERAGMQVCFEKATGV